MADAPLRIPLASGVFDEDQRALLTPSGRVALTPIETRLLAYLARRPGVVVPYRGLLDDVWGYASRVRSRTVYASVHRLRAKVEPDPSRPRHLLAVAGVGYRFEPLEPPPAAPLAARDAFVGRAGEQAEVLAALRDARLVTLHGAGGIGKTRLALSVMRGLAGAVGCDLSAARDGADVVRAVAAALRVPLGDDPAAQVGRALAARGDRVLLLDNLEQVAGPAAEVLSAWLAAAPALRLLVTSRVRLGLPEERAVAVGPLPADEARTLFVLRAAAVREGFDGAAHAADIEALVERLDGLPLAIELAAARTLVLSPGGIRARLDDRFALLASRSPGRPERHATLRAALDWSWDLLGASERRALAALATFAADAGLDAAEVVAGVDLDGLQRLVEHGLVSARPDERGEVRFRLLESVRAFVLDHPLRDDGARERHARWFARPADPASDLQRRARRVDDVRLALRWAVEGGHAALAADLALAAVPVLLARGPARLAAELLASALAVPGHPVATELQLRAQLLEVHHATNEPGRDAAWEALAARLPELDDAARRPIEHQLRMLRAGRLRELGRMDEALEALRQAREAAEGDPLRTATADHVRGGLLAFQGRFREAIALHEAALVGARSVGDRALEARVLENLAFPLANADDVPRAVRVTEEALSLSLSLGHRALEAECYASLANLALLTGDLAGACRRFAEAVDTQRAIGHLRGVALGLVDLGRATLYAGDTAAAERHLREGLVAARASGLASVEAQALRWLGTLPLEAGRPAEAEALLAEAVALERRTGLPRRVAEGLAWLARCWSELERHDEALAAWDEVLALLASGEARLVEALYRMGRAEARRRAGHLAEARADAELALEGIERHRADSERIRALCVLGRIALDAGDRPGAERLLERAETGLAATGLPAGTVPERDVAALARRLGQGAGQATSA